MNEKILFIAYQFPPIGGPGVQRSTKFVQFLSEFGYEPIVLTIKEDDIQKGSYQKDETLLKTIGENIEIIRVAAIQPTGLIKVLNKLKIYRLFWFLFFPIFWERMAMWPYFTYSRASKIIKENNIQKVYTSSGPFSSLILGFLLKKSLGVKWVADMRDPFTDSYAWSFPSKLHWKISTYFERWILSKPDHLIVNTPEVAKLYSIRKNNKNITVITNGY